MLFSGTNPVEVPTHYFLLSLAPVLFSWATAASSRALQGGSRVVYGKGREPLGLESHRDKANVGVGAVASHARRGCGRVPSDIYGVGMLIHKHSVVLVT